MLSMLRQPKKFMGYVATRCILPLDETDNLTYAASSAHYATDNITALKIAYPNWRSNEAAGGTEIATGGALAIRCGIEYPIGKYTRAYYAGAVQGSIPNGETGWTDLTTVRIPRGEMFRVHLQLDGASGTPCFTGDKGHRRNAALGDAVQQTATDLTLAGGETDDFDGYLVIRPAAIVGWTTRPSFAILGDSRQAGFSDETVDATGDSGQIARALGREYGYSNMGIPGGYVGTFVSSGTRRTALAMYATHIICGYGINDFIDGTASATVQADIATIAGRLRPRPFIQATITPYATGTFGSSNGSGQTADVTSNPLRISSNNFWRGIGAPIDKCLEVADYIELSRDDGRWKGPGYTPDGLHETSLANLAIMVARGSLATPGSFYYMPMT
jgi:hypothetical protein